jgi:hypothetical protein
MPVTHVPSTAATKPKYKIQEACHVIIDILKNKLHKSCMFALSIITKKKMSGLYIKQW